MPPLVSGDESREVKQKPAFGSLEELKQAPLWQLVFVAVILVFPLFVSLLTDADERDERLREELAATQVANEEQEALEVVREATLPIPDPTAPESEASNANCDLTGSWTSVIYQLPGQPAVTDRLRFVHGTGDRYTVVMTFDDGSTYREPAVRQGCTLYAAGEGNRYVVRENGQISLSDRDGSIRVYRPQ